MTRAASSAARVYSLVRRGGRLALALATGSRLPYSVTFILTHRCNFQCEHCDIPAAAAAEMSTDELRRAIDELADAGLARASFSGGEALVRPDAVELIAHARSRGLFTSLNTNGWLVRQNIDGLAGALDMMTLSLDGPEAVHDRVRQRRGSYRRVIEAIEAARAASIAVATITVITDDNLDIVDDVLGLAERYGFWAYFQPAYVDCFDHGSGLAPTVTSALLADLAGRLGAARRAGRAVAASPGFLERLARGPDGFGDCARCHAGRYFGTVMPDGTVVPCHLVSRAAPHPDGRAMGFARAFAAMPEKTGPGCAISPYQESDLIFGLDGRAIAAAVERVVRRPRPAG